MEDNGKYAWFFAGAAIGAVAALLLAPKSGEETRKYIGQTSKEGANAMEASGRELMDKGKELYERGKQIAEDAAELFDRGRKLVQG
jgi:gas vesicle protein